MPHSLHGMAFVRAAMVVFTLCSLAQPASGQLLDEGWRDVLGVAIDPPRVIVLASWTNLKSNPWRLRRIELAIDTAAGTLRQVVLSRWATKALVLSDSGELFLFDLTERADALNPERRVSLTGDRLPVVVRAPRESRPYRTGETFAIVYNGRGYLLDEQLLVVREYESARAIAVRGDDVVAIITEGGDVLRDVNGRIESASCQIPSDRSVVLVRGRRSAGDDIVIAARRGDATLAEFPCFEDGSRTVDLPMPALALALASEAWPERTAVFSDVASRLPAEIPRERWQFSHTEAHVHLYAPILEFASQERVFPSSTNVWRELWPAISDAPRDRKVREARLYTAYLRLGGLNRCTIYSQVTSYTGTWLLQYWLYAPFDVGGRGRHLHDSEHVFVEVDKLGGMVRRVLGSGHGGLAANNLYDASAEGVPGVTLPLFAMVELGKHATAPDIDGDGFFVPGIDENHYNERSKVWGIRDVIGSMKNEFLSYDSTMTIPRQPEHRVAVKSFAQHFDPSLVRAERHTCAIEELPSLEPRCSKRSLKNATNPDGLVACAIHEVLTHTDARNPEAIFKPTAYARLQIRPSLTGYSPWSDLGVMRRVMVDFVADLDRIPMVRRLSLPGRVALGGGVNYYRVNQDEVLPSGDLATTRRLVTRPAYGLTYDQFTANLFGFFVSVMRSPEIADDETLAIAVGPFVELPFVLGNNMMFRPALYARPTAGTVRFEMTVTLGGFPIGRDRFGYRK